MQLEPTLAIAHAVARRRRLPLAAHAVLASVATVVVGLLVAAEAAAADDLGSLGEDAVAAVEPVVEPLVPVVEPVVEPVAEGLAPFVEHMAPVTPILPSLDALPPVLERLDPVHPITAPADRGALTRPTRAEAAVVVGVATPPAVDVLPGISAPTPPSATFDAGSTTTLSLDLGELLETPVPLGGAPADAGTTLAAALLIGLFMVVSSGWASPAVTARLRPIGLTLAPPVPPG